MDNFFVLLEFLNKNNQSGGYNSFAPRNNTGIIITAVITIAIFTLLVLYYYLKNKYNLTTSNLLKRHNFNSLGRNIGLENNELKILFGLAVKNDVREPLICYTNSKILDNIIKLGLRDIENDRKAPEENKNSRSAVLLEIKAKIEKNSRQNMGIRSTHLLHENQKMVLFAREKGYIYSVIKRITHESMVVELMSEKIKSRILSVGEHLKVYFWRDEDAGYTFDTTVTGFDNIGVKRYSIRHAERLSRTQKRKYRRVPVNLSGYVIPVETVVNSSVKKYIPKEGLTVTCSIKNLSAGGLLMMVNKLRSNDKFVKVVFELNHYKIGVIGKIIRIHAIHENLYEVTVQFVRMILKEKNLINRYVYNYMPGYE